MEESNTCPVCSGYELEIEVENTKGCKTHLGSISECTSLKKCTTCSFVFRFPRISNQQALGFYQENVYWSSVDLNIYDSKRGQFRLEYLKKFISNQSSVLEKGAYNGAFLKMKHYSCCYKNSGAAERVL
ncbi:MAG: hypothetical protein KC646_15555 [Candidatus Cloacimonetes bacterium]|nr:hypothetical protein [Candidatus Cloacimonadota bacterium]